MLSWRLLLRSFKGLRGKSVFILLSLLILGLGQSL